MIFFKFGKKFLLLLLICFGLVSYCQATPKIGIIIDDLGNSIQYGDEAINLPGQVTCAFLPYRPFTHYLAVKAHLNNKEVMLHAPMQAIKPLALGKGALTLKMSQFELEQTILDDFRAVPFAVGFNNHMGSRLTEHPGYMALIMTTIQPLNVYFVDSRTINDSVAEDIARDNLVPTTHRNIFLDDHRNTKYIARQFRRLLYIARRYGSAVAIAHPYPVTLAYLQHILPKLKREHIKLVPISAIIRQQQLILS